MDYESILGLQEKCPEELFNDIPDQTSEECRAEICQRIARFLTMEYVNPELPLRPESRIKIAKGEHKGSFMAAIIKSWSGHHDGMDGLCKGDIELAADEVGVYEVLFPFDPEKLAELAEPLNETARKN